MKKTNHTWTIKELIDKINLIEFPEFQREPTVWKLIKKQRLMDSILRDFDIAPLYLFRKKDQTFDCIDGRQRINAILSFIGLNKADIEDNEFHLKISNEIFSDGNRFDEVLDKRFANFPVKWKTHILSYKINVVE